MSATTKLYEAEPRASAETLPARAVVELRGEGVLPFLHNILTCSVEKMNQGELAYGALLTPQGKILHDMFVHHTAAGVFLDCDKALRDELVAKLKLYRLRAKFEILLRDDLHVEVRGDGPFDPRCKDLGRRCLTTQPSSYRGGYDELRMILGIADSAEIGSGKLFPHEANLDLLGAVDFTKGCYIGQEVVSRMQHRGTAKFRIFPIIFTGEDFDPKFGEVLGRVGGMGLALLRLDHIVEAEGFIVHRRPWNTP